MIIWLASYPKSGNTWIRLFLDSLFLSSNEFNINKNFIQQFPLRSNFYGLSENINNQEEFAKYCIPAQQKINLDSFGSGDFEFQIPKFLNGNTNNLYLSFFWDGKLINYQYVEVMKVDKAQTLMSASFDKNFYLLGENVTLNVETNLYNGEPKGNVEFYSKYL